MGRKIAHMQPIPCSREGEEFRKQERDRAINELRDWQAPTASEYSVAIIFLNIVLTIMAVVPYRMAGIQGDRRMYSLDPWDETFSSLMIPPSTPEDWPLKTEFSHTPRKSPAATSRERVRSLWLLSNMSICTGRRWDSDTVGVATRYWLHEAAGFFCIQSFSDANSNTPIFWARGRREGSLRLVISTCLEFKKLASS